MSGAIRDIMLSFGVMVDGLVAFGGVGISRPDGKWFILCR